MTYIDQNTRMSIWCFAILRQHFSSAKPISGIFLRIDPLSSVPTQHLITPIPQPSRDNRWVSSLRFDNFHSGCQAEKAQRRASKGVKLERSSATASITSLAKA